MKDSDRAVLKVLVDHRHENEGWMYVFDIANAMKRNAYRAASLYVPLLRLERGQLVERRWDPDGPQPPKPRRAQYRANPDKVFELLEEFERKKRKTPRRLPGLGRILRPWGART